MDDDHGNMINMLAESKKEMDTSIVETHEQQYKQRARDLFAITKDMQ